MKHLPLVVGFGGYNAAGRASGHNAYKRMVFESLTSEQQHLTLQSLASLMGLTPDNGIITSELAAQILQGTLIRRIESTHFDVDQTPIGRTCELQASEQAPISLTMASKDLPNPLPSGWRVTAEGRGRTSVEIHTSQSMLVQTAGVMPVQAAGQLPSGFTPGGYYRSTHHPRGLQLTVLSASDAVHSTGIPWQTVIDHVRPDQISVYASSVMSQLDNNGFGGMMQSRMRGQRVSSKQLALGLNTMPADFVNAYVLGSVGTTAGIVGACATFAYNMKAAVADIQNGTCKVALVGSSEAPILPEVIEGYAAMSALATDAELCKLDGSEFANHRRSSRPFGENCGFTLAESGQYVMLMADDLALELGAQIFGSVPGVFVNADGYKKSISAPGPGNYITMAKAAALVKKLAGEKVLQQQSFVQAHGSSTPHNRVTESHIFDQIAATFGIDQWPVAAVKSYLGHSLGPASGDQLTASLGVFAHGILPGIKTINAVADDVYAARLAISNQDTLLGPERAQVALLNSKGFGGNNATAALCSPALTERLLMQKYSQSQWQNYLGKNETVRAEAASYEARASQGQLDPIYHFGEGVIDEHQLQITEKDLNVPGFKYPILLDSEDI